MDGKDRRAIEGLFRRLDEAGDQAPPRDPEAEALIGLKLAATPGAAYYMAQTLLVQEAALARAEERLAELEACLAERSRANGRALNGFLADVFCDGGPKRRRSRPQPARPALDRTALRPGNGFLGSAAQTAMGVAGGLLIANAIAGMFVGVPEGSAPWDVAEDGGDFEAPFDDIDL